MAAQLLRRLVHTRPGQGLGRIGAVADLVGEMLQDRRAFGEPEVAVLDGGRGEERLGFGVSDRSGVLVPGAVERDFCVGDGDGAGCESLGAAPTPWNSRISCWAKVSLMVSCQIEAARLGMDQRPPSWPSR